MWQCQCGSYNADGLQRCRCGKNRSIVMPMDVGADCRPKPKESQKTEFGGKVAIPRKKTAKGVMIGEFCESYKNIIFKGKAVKDER